MTVTALVFSSGCQSASADLPGSASFPLVPGSTIAECPESARSDDAVCVTIPVGADAIVETYKRQLHERGYRFARYLSSPSIVMLVKPDDQGCGVMVFGLPYLPPEERTALLLVFQPLDRASTDECKTLMREGAR
jgi:hypothetical protein